MKAKSILSIWILGIVKSEKSCNFICLSSIIKVLLLLYLIYKGSIVTFVPAPVAFLAQAPGSHV
jgi:hypothetical protein